MTLQRPLRILISGGGTGGHIFPAIAIANATRRRHPDCEILFVGALGRMEMERVPAAGYPIEGLPVAGFDRRKLWRNFGVAVKLMRSMLKARKILKRFRPDVAVGVGGYASGPVLKEAQKRGIPTLIQEQNSYAGVTNKLLARKAEAICVAYDGMERFFPAASIIKTGNPVRSEVAAPPIDRRRAKEMLGFSPDRKLVLVVGGSLGARTVNESILGALDRLTATGTQIMWQTGKIYFDRCEEATRNRKGVKACAFISDMATAYSAADLIVSRAGASTISEIQLRGMAAVLVPSPNVAEDHQRKNAEALSEVGAAVTVLDKDAPDRLGETIERLLADEGACLSLGEKALKMALRNSDDRIAEIIDSILGESSSVNPQKTRS